MSDDTALTIESLAAFADLIRAVRPPPPSPAAIEAAARFVGRALSVDCAAWVTPDGDIQVMPLARVAIGDILRAEDAIRRTLGPDALKWIKVGAPRSRSGEP